MITDSILMEQQNKANGRSARPGRLFQDTYSKWGFAEYMLALLHPINWRMK